MSSQKNIHWFPGHMKKAYQELAKRLQVIDLVIELVDARAVMSSHNPILNELVKNKPRILVMNKIDLSDPLVFEKQGMELSKHYPVILKTSLVGAKEVNAIKEAVRTLYHSKKLRQVAKGMKPQPARVLIVGIPNVGKSTLINKLTGRNIARVENRPGLTRSEQWIRINEEFDLLDSPGVLSSNYAEAATKMNLALINSMPLNVLPLDDLAEYLAEYLDREYCDLFAKYAALDGKNAVEISFFFDYLATKLNYLIAGKPDSERAKIRFIKDFQDGVIGRISLEK